jgi:hypothetical protein
LGLLGAAVGVLGDMAAGVRLEELLSWLESGMQSGKAKLVCGLADTMFGLVSMPSEGLKSLKEKAVSWLSAGVPCEKW